ncbi:hypothetical protein NSP_22600 [Nodularia spumigena CCY9414]|nr:hypothetical protein NSP_22600 [Nodularia spumigena CCY9414]
MCDRLNAAKTKDDRLSLANLAIACFSPNTRELVRVNV